MGGKKTARPGLVLSVVGGVVLAIAAGLLVFGIAALSAVTYGESGASPWSAYLTVAAGALALLGGGASLVVGRRRHAANMNRPRTYADQNGDHTLTAEDRPTNPYDTATRRL